MRKGTSAVVGLLGVLTVVAVAHGVGMLVPRVSAQNSGFHVLPVTNGGGTCRDMTNDLRTDSETWRAAYVNYVAGFVTGANFVSYSVGGRNSNVGSGSEVLPIRPGQRVADAVSALVEQYCVQNPSKNISEAVARVYSQLLTR
jgi:hypothetical protein